jgi:biotin carboxylase
VEGPGAATGKRLLVLGAGPAQLGLLGAAREQGLFVIALDRDPTAPGFRYADRRAIISTEDEHGIERLASAERVEGIIAPGIDWPVGIAARVAERLGLPHPIDASVANRAVSKQKQREALAEAKVPQPSWHIVSEPEEGLPVPSVVKAPDRQGQKGLTLVRSEDELPAAIGRAIEESRSGVAIVEELVDGPEVTVNAFSLRGEFHPLTVTDRLTADPPAFGVALVHVWPARSARPRSGQGEGVRGNREVHPGANEAAGVAAAAVSALGIENGPSYTQLRIGPDGPQVIEVAARLGGGHDAELAKLALGVDLNGLALQAALGEPIWSAALQPTPEVGGAVVRFLVPPEGVLEEVEGADEARAVEGVQDVRIYREPGHVFGPFRRGADRAGAVLAIGDSREEALERAEEAVALVRFSVADTSDAAYSAHLGGQ